MSKKSGQVSKKVGQMAFEQIMVLFFEYPEKRFSVREIEQKTGIKKSTVQNNLNILKKEGIISQENKFNKSSYAKLKKITYYLEKFEKSGLFDYLETEFASSAIILFGSFRKGESTKESDIDLFIEAGRNKTINLIKFEKLLGHNIQLFVEPKITKLPPKLLNNVINGIKVRGYFVIR